MSQKVIIVGNSVAITIPKETAKKLGFRSGRKLDFHVDEETSTISYRPVNQISGDDMNVAKLTANFMRRYDKDLRNLADR